MRRLKGRRLKGRRPISPPAAARGSMTVELAILAPAMLLLIMFVVLCGRVIEARGQVDGAARDAARAASIARSAGQAELNATQAAQADLTGWCSGDPSAQVTGFVPGSPQVVVSVTCQVNLEFVKLGPLTVTGGAVAPLDTFVARS